MEKHIWKLFVGNFPATNFALYLNVNLSEVKRRFGNRLCFKGNVNTIGTIAKGSKEDVMDEAKKCIEDAAEGGGFILASGDQVPVDTPEENFEAFIKAARIFGKY